MAQTHAQTVLRGGILSLGLCSALLLAATTQVASAASNYQQTITLSPGWNIVSTPKLVDSHTFSVPETLSNFSIYALDASRISGWATMADLSQSEFTPLYGYFINNKTGSTQTLTFNYKASTTPNERLFTRAFSGSGWYSFGIANPSYAKQQGGSIADTNNPDHILNSLLGATSNYDSVLDFTNGSFGVNPDSAALVDPWKLAVRSADVTNTTEINSLNDFRETKGYAIYIKSATTLNGFQNDSANPAPIPTKVTLDATSTPVGNLTYGQVGATLAVFKFTNNDSTSVSVTDLMFKRTGISADSTLSNISLYDGADTLVVGGGTFSSGALSFSNPTGIISVAAAGSALLKIRANVISTSTVSQTVGLMLSSATSSAFAASGTPVSSPVRQIVAAPPTSITVVKASAYANQTTVAPQTAFKIGEYNLTAGAGDGLNLNQFTISFSGTGDVANLQDIYVAYGAKTTAVKSVVSSSSNVFSISELVSSSATLNIKVYATINAGAAASVNYQTGLRVDGTAQSTGLPAVGSSTGQIVTIGIGTFTGNVDASTPISALVVGNTTPKIASYKFISSNDAFTIVDLSASTFDSSSVIELVFKDGATELGRQPFNGTSLTKTGLNLLVAANTSKVIDVYANLGSVGTNAGSSGGNVGVTLTSLKYRNSNGVETATSSFSGSGIASSLIGNPMYVYKTKPTITNVALPTTVLANGTQTVYQYSVTADAGGTVAWRITKFNIAETIAAAATFNLYDSTNQSTVLTNTACVRAVNVVTCTSTIDQEVNGSKTYVLKATVSGAASGASISVNIPSSALGFVAPIAAGSVGATATFVWSDESVTPHSNLTADWNNDNLVKNLPTDSLTMTK